MNLKTTTLLLLMTPALAMLSGCNPSTPDADTPATDAASVPATDMPAGPMPADTTPVPTMPADTAGAMPSTDNLAFGEIDKSGDGSIARDELGATDMLSQHFSTADTDGNGMLSEAEVTKHRADMAAAPAN